MGKSVDGKVKAALGAVALLGAAGQIVRRVRGSHYQLLSRSGEELLEKQEAAWSAYPRPQLRRESFICLNGEWELNGRKIQVPFPPQSLLSGYEGRVGTRLEYVKKFGLSAVGRGQRALLHFGAVDQVAEVFINGHYLGKHEGGYLPFSFDVTEYVREGKNVLLVKAKDTLSVRYPYGKQRKFRGGMWYTPVSGIWQSVWMEYVPEVYIRRLEVKADTGKVRVSVKAGGVGRGGSVKEPDGITIAIKLHNDSWHTVHAETKTAEIDLTEIRLEDGSRYRPVLWSTERPYLYEMTVAMGEDRVSSYFGLRKVEVKKVEGVPRVCLNGRPVFLQGVLDQGYFCDGIYLPSGEREYEEDVLRMKALGMNLLRKHIKIEPECFYYYCDVHGMLVMQDMVNSGFYSWIKDTALPTLGFCRKKDGRRPGGRRRKEFFRQHMKDTIRHLYNHPCVIAYTIFNEGWGQFDSDVLYEEARKLDSTRLYDAASGWFAQEKSDFDSQHIYFKKLSIPKKPERPVLVSECGGYSLRVPGHFYARYAGYGYGDCKDRRELAERVRKLYERAILPAVPKGLCGCIYTQLSDVEDETNGFYTYDRRVCKVEEKGMREIAERLSAAVSGKIRDNSEENYVPDY